MIIPVRCFTCGKVVGNKWESYLELCGTEGKTERSLIVLIITIMGLNSSVKFDFLFSSLPRQALDELGLTRYCCRRMVLTHVDLISKLLAYNSTYIRDVVDELIFYLLTLFLHFIFDLNVQLCNSKAEFQMPENG